MYKTKDARRKANFDIDDCDSAKRLFGSTNHQKALHN